MKITAHISSSAPTTLHTRLNTLDVMTFPHGTTPLESLLSIKDSDILIINNPKGRLTEQQVFEIAYAMVKKKNIIMMFPPQYPQTILSLLKESISNRLSKIIICDLSQLDSMDLASLISAFQTGTATNYSLTKKETVLIRSYTKAYLTTKKNFSLLSYHATRVPE